MSIIATCLTCKKSWDVDMDPTQCTCTEPGDDEWVVEVDEDG